MHATENKKHDTAKQNKKILRQFCTSHWHNHKTSQTLHMDFFGAHDRLKNWIGKLKLVF